MPDDTLFDNFPTFWVKHESAIAEDEVARLNKIFHDILDWPTSVVVEKFLAQTMSGDLDMGENDLNNVGTISGDGPILLSTLGDVRMQAAGGQNAQIFADRIEFGASDLIQDFIMESNKFFPATDNTKDMGATGTYFKDIYGYTMLVKTAIDMSVGTPDILLKDAEAAALEFKEATNMYMRFITTNSSEAVEFGKAVGIGQAPNEMLDVYGTGDVAMRIESGAEGAGEYARIKFVNKATELAAGTLGVWYFDNSLADATGSYNLVAEATGNPAAYGSTTPSPEQGTHYLELDGSDANTCMHTSGNITGTVQTTEFYIYSEGTFNKWAFDGDGVANKFAMQYLCNGAAATRFLFSVDGYNYYDDNLGDQGGFAWYHYGITNDGVNCEIFRDDVSVKDAAKAYQSVNKTWHVGNLNAHNVACDAPIDMFRISSDVKTDFPTVDAAGTATEWMWFGWSDGDDRAELNVDGKDFLMDIGAGALGVIAASMKIGDGGTTDYAAFSSIGDLSFAGGAGFYPRRVSQSAIPADGVGATQIDVGELMVWRDSDDSKTYLVYQDTDEGVRSVEMT